MWGFNKIIEDHLRFRRGVKVGLGFGHKKRNPKIPFSF